MYSNKENTVRGRAVKHVSKNGKVNKNCVIWASILCFCFLGPGCSKKTKNYIGSGNISNGGFATGNQKYTFYVSKNSMGESILWMQNNDSEEVKRIHSSTCAVDRLTLAGEFLFYRSVEPNQTGYDITISRYSFDKDGTEIIYSYHSFSQNGLDFVTIWDSSIFFSEEFRVLKCDLDGSNQTLLYESETRNRGVSSMPICVTKDKVLFVEPAYFVHGGSYFGEVYSMNHDGSNLTALGVQSDSESNFFADGTWLYYMSSRCKLDGSEVETLCDYTTQINCLNDDVFYGDYDKICLLGEDTNATISTSGNWIGGFVIVGDRIFFHCLHGGQELLYSVQTDGKNEMILCGNATKYIYRAFAFYRQQEDKDMCFIVLPSEIYDAQEEYGEIGFTVRVLQDNQIGAQYAEVIVDTDVGEVSDDRGNRWLLDDKVWK